jgi:hypothetical protein
VEGYVQSKIHNAEMVPSRMEPTLSPVGGGIAVAPQRTKHSDLDIHIESLFTFHKQHWPIHRYRGTAQLRQACGLGSRFAGRRPGFCH